MKDKNLKKAQLSKDKILKEEVEATVLYTEAEIKIKYIQGKVLTIIEASALNPVQCEAVKNLVKHVFSEELTKLYNWSHNDAQMLTEADMVGEDGTTDDFYEQNQPTDEMEPGKIYTRIR